MDISSSLFYNNEELTKLCDLVMNHFYRKEMAEEIDKNKGVWTDVTVRDLKQQYVVRLMMDVLKLDRNLNYSNAV